MHGQQNDKYTEMHGQQNDKYTEMHGQQNDKYTQMHGQQNNKYTEMHDQQNDKYIEVHCQQNDKYTEMHGQQNDKYIQMHGQQNFGKKLLICNYFRLVLKQNNLKTNLVTKIVKFMTPISSYIHRRFGDLVPHIIWKKAFFSRKSKVKVTVLITRLLQLLQFEQKNVLNVNVYCYNNTRKNTLFKL